MLIYTKNASVQVIQQCMPDYRVTKDTNTCTTAAKTIEQQKQNKQTKKIYNVLKIQGTQFFLIEIGL